MRRPLSMLAAGLGLAMGVCVGVCAVREWQFQRELRQAQEDFNARRIGGVRLTHGWPGWRGDGPAGRGRVLARRL